MVDRHEVGRDKRRHATALARLELTAPCRPIVFNNLDLGSAQVLPSVARGVEADFGGLQIVVGPSWEVELVAYAAG